MQYLTYDEYVEIGGTLDETSFKRVVAAVNAVVDKHTQCRLLGSTEIPENVKSCVRDLCEYFDFYGNSAVKITSKSQSAGGVSESENYATKSHDEFNMDVTTTIHDYLSCDVDKNGTPLLYKGCKP